MPPPPPPPKSSAYAIGNAPIATNDQRVCFICLQTDTDTPNTTWVNPCPCSLEAHNHCMLRWIAEMESSPQRVKDGFRCQACKALITVEDPFDSVVALQDAWVRRYSRWSPALLALVVSTGCVTASASYGMAAFKIFAGPEVANIWFFRRPRLVAMITKALALSTIGPGIILLRWIPSVGMPLLLPVSFMYSAHLVATDNPFEWPPSPQWAMALLPCLHLCYSHVFWDIFGSLDRRLNRILRGLPPDENNAGAEAQEAAPQDAALQAAQQEPAANDRQDGGVSGRISALFGNISQWFSETFLDTVEMDIGIEVEVDDRYGVRILANADVVDLDNDDQDANNAADRDEPDADGEYREEIIFEASYAMPPRQPAANPALAQAAQQPAALQNPTSPPPSPPPPPPPQQPQAHTRPNSNNNDDPANDNNTPAPPANPGPLALISNSIITSLLFPFICYGMGELLRALLPRRMTTAPVTSMLSWGVGRPPGLLQQRWGRSFAGGCLWVVLRDLLSLYAKYRRAQMRGKRRVKNVPRKQGKGASSNGTGMVGTCSG
ncbi:hypothetical protein VTJ83DRAFT_5102 [Remersonia thermophila]|uniref:RING-CH-type domain-containing protein n=1 Tax=Remersonia thermophila TaxID=72144 RepID=A0ABR4DCK4_9PEZI